jgi:signal transduction histidine kinase/ActR/RegA family two-component response regulator
MHLGIRAQLVCYTLGTAFLVGGITVAHSIYKQRAAIHQEHETRATTMASSVAKALIDAFYESDIRRIAIQLEIIQRDPDILTAIAFDEAGSPIVTGGRDSGAIGSIHGLDLKQLRNADWQAYSSNNDDVSLTAISAVQIADGDPLGFIGLTLSQHRALNRIRTATIEQAGLLGGLFILGIITAAVLSRRLVKQIYALNEGIIAIRDGSTSDRIDIAGHNELTQLAESINIMAENLERTTVSRTELKYANEEIEARSQSLVAQQRELIYMNEGLQKAQEIADSASKIKSEFLANMSHEIRTPMTAILGFAETISDNVVKPENIEAIAIIRKNGEYLLHIINDILDLSKIESGKIDIEIAQHNPCEIINQVESLVKNRALAKGLKFEIEYIGDIPETVWTDITRLRQILINIIGNAIKFTESGSVKLTCRIVRDKESSLLQMSVRDTGIGIDPDQAANLFQPFIQADNSTTRKYGGSGLGLAISKRFAELLGGNISLVASEAGVGSCFRATVTTGSLEGVKKIEDPGLFTGRDMSKLAPESAAVLTGKRLLLAEDGPDNQRLISFVLTKAGAEVLVMENGKLALDAALAARNEGREFDCILMDMQMPVMSGYEATSELRKANYTGPIIALTAHAMEGDREKCIDAGCDDFANKPIDRVALINMVARFARPSSAAA